MKGIKSENLKIKMWFCDKDLSSVNSLSKTHKITNENIESVKSEKIKVKVWFCDKDLSSVKLFSKTDDFTNTHKFINNYTLFYKHDKFTVIIKTYY